MPTDSLKSWLSAAVAASAALPILACSGPHHGHGADVEGDMKAIQGHHESAQSEHGHHGHHGDHAKHEGHGPIGHTFEDVDKYAARWNDPARDDWQKPDEVIALMGITAGMTVADIGPGTGYFEPHLAKAVGSEGRVLALDVEPNMVEYLQRRGKEEGWTNVESRLVEYGDPKMKPGEVARVVVVNTWHHIRDREAYGAKVFAGIAPGGSITIVEYTLEAEAGPPVDIRLKPEQVIAELEAAGFKAEKLEETLPKQYIVIGRKAP